MSNLLEIICLKCQNLKEITKDGKYVKIVENPKAFCFRVGRSLLESKYPIIENNFISYIHLVKHNMSPQFFLKSNRNCCKRWSHYVKNEQSFKNLPKKLPLFIIEISKITFFLLLKWILKNKNNYLAPKY